MRHSLPDEKQERVSMLIKLLDSFTQQMQKVPQGYIGLYFTCLTGCFSDTLKTISTLSIDRLVKGFAVTEKNCKRLYYDDVHKDNICFIPA